MAWQYKREERQFEEIPAGRYRVRIDSAEKAVSQKGNDMLIIKMTVSGQTRQLWDFIVFLDDRPEITNRKLTQLFDAFGIEEGDFNLANYAGKAGAVQIKHDEEGKARVHYYLVKGSKGEQELPPFVDKGGEFLDLSKAGAGDDIPFEF